MNATFHFSRYVFVVFLFSRSAVTGCGESGNLKPSQCNESRSFGDEISAITMCVRGTAECETANASLL